MCPALGGIRRRWDGPMVVPKASPESRCQKFSTPHWESAPPKMDATLAQAAMTDPATTRTLIRHQKFRNNEGYIS